VTVRAAASAWISHAGNDLLTAPLPSSELSSQPSLDMPAVTAAIPAHGETKVILSAPVQNRLRLGLPMPTCTIGHDGCFGQPGDRQQIQPVWWAGPAREPVSAQWKALCHQGDSWHFLGIPQMTRRYAWHGSALRDAHLNAVRLMPSPIRLST